MGLETISVPEKQKHIPNLTNEEYFEIFGGGDREKIEEWMQKQGIEPDEEGYLRINIGSKEERVDVADDIGKIYEMDEEDKEN